jgi:hypothetical protein
MTTRPDASAATHGNDAASRTSASAMKTSCEDIGPAGLGREWHHIVEKRLAGRPGFPQEKIHSTDNIVSLPIEVHRRVSARMSMRDEAYNFNIRRFGIEKRTFAEQYDDGLDLVRKILEEYGYDPSNF